MGMDMDIYDVILLVLGLFFGQIAGHIFIYRFLHPLRGRSILEEEEDDIKQIKQTGE